MIVKNLIITRSQLPKRMACVWILAKSKTHLCLAFVIIKMQLHLDFGTPGGTLGPIGPPPGPFVGPPGPTKVYIWRLKRTNRSFRRGELVIV